MTSLFPEQTIHFLPRATQRGLIEIERMYQMMDLSGHATPKYLDKIQSSIETFASILEEAICDNDNTRLLDQIQSIDDAIIFISNAITNRLQASRFLYDTKFFNQKSIGPYSKVYQFYEDLVEHFGNLINQYNQHIHEGANSKLNFLLNILIHSTVKVQLFVPSTCSDNPKNRFLGIVLNEYSFFNLTHTVTYILHEIGHYVPPFSRRERNNLFFKIYSSVLKKHIIDYLTEIFYKELKGKELDAGAKDNFPEDISLCFDKLFSLLSQLAEELTDEYFTKYAELSKKQAAPDFYILDDYKQHISKAQLNLAVNLNEILLLDTLEKGDEPRRIEELLLQKLDGAPSAEILKLANGAISYRNLFDLLCDFSQQLFTAGGLFYNEADNSANNEYLAVYLKGISYLALNENTKKNKELFSAKFFQFLKKALDELELIQIVETIHNHVDEAIADHFSFRALDITSVDFYWKIFGSIYLEDSYSLEYKRKSFGGRIAIAIEYLRKFEKKPITVPDEAKTIIEFADTTSGEENGLSVEDKQNLIYRPIANFLYTKNVFPEIELFQSVESKQGPTPNFRKNFRALVDTNSSIAAEISLLQTFNNTSDDFLQ